MRIPQNGLSQEALRGIVEEYVTREGTEYGSRDYSLEEKVMAVLSQLDRGEIVIDYDPETGTCNLLGNESRTAIGHPVSKDRPIE